MVAFFYGFAIFGLLHHRVRKVVPMCLSLSRLALPAAVFVVIGCAASTSGGRGGATFYTKQLGQATPTDLSRKTRMILDRFRLELEQEDSTVSQQLFITRWTGRFPFQDELDSGVVEAMSRLTIRARARGAGGRGAANLRVVQLTAENMVRIGEGAEWQWNFLSPMFKKYVDEIAQALKTEFESGIRVF